MPRYLRAFADWLDSLPVDDPVRRLSLRLHQPKGMVFGLGGWPDALRVEVWPGEIRVSAYRGQECWDILVCFESAARRDGDGQWFCADCLEEHAARRWPSEQALWIEHDFEDLHAWLVEKVVPATRLELHALGGVRWAALAGPAAAIAPQDDSLVQTVWRAGRT